jgi:ribosome biogenesis GTPase A
VKIKWIKVDKNLLVSNRVDLIKRNAEERWKGSMKKKFRENSI